MNDVEKVERVNYSNLKKETDRSSGGNEVTT
jgi:hypothetical protein